MQSIISLKYCFLQVESIKLNYKHTEIHLNKIKKYVDIMLYENNISIWNGLKMTSKMLLLIRIFRINDIVLFVIVPSILKNNEYKHCIKEVKTSIQGFFFFSPLKCSTLRVRLSESVISSILRVVLVLMLIDETGCTLCKALRQCLGFLRSISCKWLSLDRAARRASVCTLSAT